MSLSVKEQVFLEQWLEPNERLIWAGKPDYYEILFDDTMKALLSAVATCVMVLWTINSMSSPAFRSAGVISMEGFRSLLHALIALALLLTTCVFIWRAANANSYLYGLTGKRALISIGGKEPASFYAERFKEMEVTGSKKPKGVGTVYFDYDEDAEGHGSYQESFYAIEDAHRVADLIREYLLEGSRGQP